MAKRPIRHRAICPGCQYPHVIFQHEVEGYWLIGPHNAPRVDPHHAGPGGQCPGSGAMVPAPSAEVRGPGPQSGEKAPNGRTTFVLPSKRGQTVREMQEGVHPDEQPSEVLLEGVPESGEVATVRE